MEAMQQQMPDQSLHAQVRAARKRQKMTQREVATKAEIGLRTYQMFERGGHNPQPANLRAIRWAVGLEEEGEPTPTPIRSVPSVDGLDDEGWPLDVRIFLDVVGAFLVTMEESDRIEFIHDATRWIVARRR